MTPKYYPELDETLYTRVMENGLTVCLIPKKGFTKKMAYFHSHGLRAGRKGLQVTCRCGALSGAQDV